jgi:hypothetical protein
MKKKPEPVKPRAMFVRIIAGICAVLIILSAFFFAFFS